MFKFLFMRRTTKAEVEKERKKTAECSDVEKKKLDDSFASLETMMNETLKQLQEGSVKMITKQTEKAKDT